MKTHKLLLGLPLGAVLLLNACGSDNDIAPMTGTAAVADQLITDSTSETALPLPINDLVIDDDSSDSALPMEI